MIYRNNYFSKELRQAYIENKISFKRQMMLALFLGLVSFAMHFVFQTLTESVLSDVVPEFMQPSYFSTIYTYINVALIFNAIYFIVYYEYLSFEEIRKNRWYMLVKMGYEPMSMIFSKLIARIFYVLFVYSIGFVFTIFLTIFLKYNFVYQYFAALYITGLIDLIIIVTVSMTASLYLKNLTNARYFVFFSAVSIIVFKVFSGYYKIVSNRVLMQNIYNLFNFSKSLYLPLSAFVVSVCLIVSIIRAGSIAKYYNLPYYASDLGLPEGTSIALADAKTGKLKSPKVSGQYKARTQSKILNALTTAFLVFFVISALLFNVLIVLISTSQPGKEVTIFGTIPYVFKTDTMEPSIMKNDLAYFERVDIQAFIDQGQIVLFLEDNIVYVERVISKENGKYIVDIDKYPPMAQQGAMRKTLERDQIYGVFTGRNRWLGALILFANTIIGRLVFLLVPAILLFFYKPLVGLVNQDRKKSIADEQV